GMRLADGTLWPIPITLDVTKAFAEPLQAGGKVALRDPEGVLLAVLTVGDVWEADRQEEAQKVFGTTDHAVRTQIWIAISVYLLVAIARKRLGIERDLYTILQILSVYAFEKAPLAQVLSSPDYTPENDDIRNQLSLFDL
ncbi:unnamed protein product, partial [marine sediment metagenome]